VFNTLRIATWNINGAVRPVTNDTVVPEELYELIGQIDVLCLQEVPFCSSGSLAGWSSKLSDKTNLPYCASLPLSPSHLHNTGSVRIGIAMFSRHPLLTVSSTLLPNPCWMEPFPSHDKGAIIARILREGDSNAIAVATTHFVPFTEFNKKPSDDECLPIWSAFAEFLKNNPKPSFVIGDFNCPTPYDHLPLSRYDDAIRSSTHRKGQMDHIFYDRTYWRLIEQSVTMHCCSDHAFCFSKFIPI